MSLLLYSSLHWHTMDTMAYYIYHILWKELEVRCRPVIDQKGFEVPYHNISLLFKNYWIQKREYNVTKTVLTGFMYHA